MTAHPGPDAVCPENSRLLTLVAIERCPTHTLRRSTRRDRPTAPGQVMYHPERNTKSFLAQWIPYQAGGGYRYFTGSLAFVLHRVSGIALIVYLILHIISITKAGNLDPTDYDVVMRRFQEPDFKVGEIALWAAVLFHGINGIRILLVDFVLDRSHISKQLFWYFAVLIMVLLIAGAIPLILHSNVQPILYAGGN